MNNLVSFNNLVQNNILFDSHCHLCVNEFDGDRDTVASRAEQVGVKAIIDVGVDMKTSHAALDNSKKYASVYAAIGVEPENLVPGSDLFDKEVFDLSEETFQIWLQEKETELGMLASDAKVLMIGETGIDNYWLTKRVETGELEIAEQGKSLARQIELFKMHCRLAKKFNKPMTIHSRNAILKCLEVLNEMNIGKGLAVFHSLTLDVDDTEESFAHKAKAIIDRGYFIGVNGIITFKNAALIRNVYAKIIGKEFRTAELKELYAHKFILETDAPFLAPEPKRGERNEPSFIEYI